MAFSLGRLWLVAGAVLVVASFVGSGLIADLFAVPAIARDGFVLFVRLMSVAELCQIGLVLSASALRGYGRPREGSMLLVLASLIQLGGVAALGLGAGMGALSVPLCIIIASAAGTALGVAMLRKAELWTSGAWRQYRPHALGMVLKIGLPIAITQIVLFVANGALVAILTPLGPGTAAGFSTAVSLQFLILMPGIVLGTATSIVLNQQRGAGHGDWLPGTLRVGLELSLGVYVVIALLVWFGNDLLGGLLTNEPAVSGEVALYLGVVGLTYVFNGPVLAALAIMEQIGAGLVAVALNVVYFAAMVICAATVLNSAGTSLAFYQAIAWCNVVGVCLVAGAVIAVRRAARAPAPAHP